VEGMKFQENEERYFMTLREILAQIKPTEFLIADQKRQYTVTSIEDNPDNIIEIELQKHKTQNNYSFGLNEDIPEELLNAKFIKLRVEFHQRQSNAYLFFCTFVFTLTD
jgi:hypothetical protein